jgi:hypothetical protein
MSLSDSQIIEELLREYDFFNKDQQKEKSVKMESVESKETCPVNLHEAVIKFVLFENGVPKELHAEFIGQNFAWIMSIANKKNMDTFLNEVWDKIPKLKFKDQMSDILDGNNEKKERENE